MKFHMETLCNVLKFVIICKKLHDKIYAIIWSNKMGKILNVARNKEV